MKRHLVTVLLSLGVATAACGGGSGAAAKPAEAPGTEAGATTDPASTTTSKAAEAGPSGGAAGGAAEGPVASSNSEDVRKGIAAMKGGNWNGARDAFEAAVKKNPKQADAHYYLGVVMEKTGDKASAEKHYKDALALDPNLHEATVNLTAFYVEAQKWDDAIGLAKKAVAKNNKDADMHLNLGVALSGKGDQPGAAKAFDEALRLEPNNAQFFVTYAQHLATWKKTPEAVAKLKQAMSVAHDDPAVLGEIGFELRGLRAVPECIQAMDKAIAAKDNGEFRTIRAQCKFANKDKAGAMADVQAAVAKEPEYAPAHYWLGSWQGEDGKFKEAAASFETYLKLAPQGPLARQAEAKIKLAKEKDKAKK